MSFVYASRGIGNALRGQPNLRIQLLVGVAVVVAAVWVDVTIGECCILLLCIAVVTGMEMMNSAIEELVDIVSPERRMIAGRVKDIAAGAVLWCSVISSAIGIMIFSQYW